MRVWLRSPTLEPKRLEPWQTFQICSIKFVYALTPSNPVAEAAAINLQTLDESKEQTFISEDPGPNIR